MESRIMAENIATRMRDDQEYLRAWAAVLNKKLGSERWKVLQEEVEVQIAKDRSDPSSRESLALFERELGDAKTDSALISVLHSWGLGRWKVGPY